MREDPENGERERRRKMGSHDMGTDCWWRGKGGASHAWGAHKNLTCRFPELLLLDVTRLAHATGSSKNSEIMWILGQTNVGVLANLAEENNRLRGGDHASPVPVSVEEVTRRAEALRLLERAPGRVLGVGPGTEVGLKEVGLKRETPGWRLW